MLDYLQLTNLYDKQAEQAEEEERSRIDPLKEDLCMLRGLFLDALRKGQSPFLFCLAFLQPWIAYCRVIFQAVND